MSTKISKRNTPTKASNVIVTRKRAALQNRRLRGRPRKTVKPVINKTKKPEISSPKSTKIDTVSKDTPLQTKVRTLVRFVERVEYYPDKLKRDISNKKILLKPKHNYKIIAASNKRKLAVPKKGVNIPSKKLRTYSSSSHQSELSMVEMVKLIEDSHNLSDEDFMEILTCPSPVWWEDPPDDGYIEDAISFRSPETSQTAQNIVDTNKAEEQNKHNNKTITQINKREKNKINTQIKNKKTTDKNNFESIVNRNKEVKQINDKVKFNEKKQKLECVLGSIKNVKNSDKNVNIKDEIKNVNKNSSPVKSRRVSNSTDGDNMSDMSFNEEEILKSLESLDIPVEQSSEIHNSNDEKIKIYIKTSEKINNEINSTKTEMIPVDNALVPKFLPPLKRKPILNNEIKIKENSDTCTEYNLEYMSNFRFISDDDVNLGKNNNENIKNIDSASQKSSKNDSYLENNNKNDELCSQKSINDLAEYATVNKLLSNDISKKKNTAKCNENTKIGNTRENMNSFLKKCKSNKRLKKSVNSPTSSMAKDLNLEKENSNEQTSVGSSENRLKSCNYCVVKAQNGAKNLSCADCQTSPLFYCDICNFAAEKSVSSCKDVARISWKHNYLVNET